MKPSTIFAALAGVALIVGVLISLQGDGGDTDNTPPSENGDQDTINPEGEPDPDPVQKPSYPEGDPNPNPDPNPDTEPKPEKPEPSFVLGQPRSALQKNVILGEYSDQNLSTEFSRFLKRSESPQIYVLNATGTSGEAEVFYKCIFDRDREMLLVLNRTVTGEDPQANESHQWMLWRDIGYTELLDGIPWSGDRGYEISLVTKDRLDNLPIRFPGDPTIATWP